MSADDALQMARAAGVDLSIDEDDLVLEAASEPAPAVLDMLRQHKAEIIKLLRRDRQLDGHSFSAQDWRAFFGERAEIAEWHGGLSRNEAEVRAFDWCVGEWLNRNPVRSRPGRCFSCGGAGYVGSHNPLLPFRMGRTGEVWLHSGCQSAWHAGRKAKAIAALAEMGIVAPVKVPDDFGACPNAAEGPRRLQPDQPTGNKINGGIEADSGVGQEPRPSADPIRPGVNDTAGFVGSVTELEERAALVETGAGVPRTWAEGFAALCAMPPPTGFMPERWRRVIDAAGMFLDRWAAVAIACGWTDLDVFGAHPTRPAARYDAMGLVLLLDRYEVVAIDEHGADLVTNTGAPQRFLRRPLPAGTISLWELAR